MRRWRRFRVGSPVTTGNVDGYVYVPIGSEPVARVANAASPQPGYKGLAGANVTVTCGNAVKKQ